MKGEVLGTTLKQISNFFLGEEKAKLSRRKKKEMQCKKGEEKGKKIKVGSPGLKTFKR